MGSAENETVFTFLPLGAIIQEFRIAGHNIVQGFPTEDNYRKLNAPHFGATIGRTSNRIKDATFKVNGKSYTLEKNNGPNNLHGGPYGWGKKDFTGPKPVNRNGKEGVMFTYLSPDGDQGFPGTVECRVWYVAGKEMEGGVEKTVLDMEYEVEFVGDECEETIVGMTNHSYFNLSKNPTIAGMRATLSSNKYLPIDSTGIPHGHMATYPDKTIQPNTPFTLGPTDPQVDDCFIVNESPSSVSLDTRSSPLNHLASLYAPDTNIHLEVSSTEPAFQFYTAKYVDVPAVEGMPARGPRSGVCIEPQRYVNSMNVDEWRPMALLKQGQVYGSRTVYKAWKE